MHHAITASLSVVLLAAGSPEAFAQQISPGSIVGIWQSEDGSAKFEMVDAGDTYAGRVIFNRRMVEADGKTFKTDARNPDPKLRSRSLQGITFLRDLKWDAADRRWEGGALYDPSSGRNLSARVSLDGGKLAMRAYIGSPMLGRTVTFNRVVN